MTLYPVSISLGAYGADYVRRRGQASFIPLLAAAGVTWIELREELGLPEPAATAAAIADAGLTCVYSSPLELWQLDQAAPNPAVAEALQQAQRFGAVWLKVSLGHYSPLADVAALKPLLRETPVRLLVENDQTPQGGRIAPLVQFFDKAAALDVPVGMTFDAGNWHWQNESAFAAALELGHRVQYLHCKGVQRREGKWHAVPPTPEDLQLWQQLLARMPGGIVRAVEFPLQGDDLLALTAEHCATLARLGQPTAIEPRQEVAHG
ncbi:AP endonuclease [Pseudomonas sp. HR96]|uniref:AP endonuclease n=1 Tax=Pseudomonas sp. HR96 TaxID=1027966 RepID=UPI002A74965C|nr:AP endonuclease [Pseudomonas sp. HR96]WPP02090.1 AP endonuclease [Pseudomonas sp. HR96]